ncbi:hypothetical protein JQC91_15785 [Jannaschia sp. Os4]|uniref:hypothetical protein n=1 Tax=Jannaschia sp. Os4 TaxID=2807617 RepID=UPI00193AC594|nr:hypothetical protein [Jannaschia sp. Os4]MBM2577768.1 hypothetical protein [Jannaschia sp. Os4]
MIRPLLLTAALAACAPAVETPAPAPAAAGGPAPGIAGGIAGADAVGTALQRRWVSIDDPARAITIDRSVDGHTFGTQTDGLTDSVEPLRFVSDCDARAPALADSGSFTVGADGALCYRVLSLTPGELVLSRELGGPLRYRPG